MALPNALAGKFELPVTYQRFLFLAQELDFSGNATSIYLCLDSESNGAVYAVDSYLEQPPRFVNASVLQLAESLDAYRAVPSGSEAKAADKASIKIWVDGFAANIDRIDPAAAADKNSWWSVIIEEMRLFT